MRSQCARKLVGHRMRHPCIILWEDHQFEHYTVRYGILQVDESLVHRPPSISFVLSHQELAPPEQSFCLQIKFTSVRNPKRLDQLEKGIHLFSCFFSSLSDAEAAAGFFAAHWVSLWNAMAQLDGASGLSLKSKS